ncbi:hypothetical protein [Rhodococcus sp. NCIMB 12038]|uniref:hypothetical protein n=1 Tax=Rhodococcus sp. NCIMB 12038 TaxID=933800 RepID=UPI000B3C84C2|nr:hypothetical protein [Rhodococcus sp. NCIMB 12038]
MLIAPTSDGIDHGKRNSSREVTQAFLMTAGRARDKEQSPDELDEAFRREVADVFCQTLLLARFHDIDRTSAVNDKWLVWAEGRIDS